MTISSNDDEDALIEQMMADVASIQKDADTVVAPVLVASTASPIDDDETESEGEMSPKVQEPITHTTLTFAVEEDVPSTKTVKEVKPKAKTVKAVKEAKPKKETKPKAAAPTKGKK